MVRSSVALLCAAALVAGGCGSDSDSDSSSSSAGAATSPAGGAPAEAASKFIACFSKPGYEAEHPASGDESLFALSVKKRGYDSVPVNVTKPDAIAADVYLVFFASPEDATNAVREAAVVNEGDVKPVVRGAAVAGYFDQSARDAVGAAVEKCLG